MSFFERIKQSIIVGYLKQMFSKENLTQRSTITALVVGLAAVLNWNLTPEAQDQVVGAVLTAINAILGIVATYNFVRDEKKLPWQDK